MAHEELHASTGCSMRDRWAEHTMWSRQYLVATLGNLPDRSAATDRLLTAQERLGSALVPCLGEVISARLVALLKERTLFTGYLLYALSVWDEAEAQRQREVLRAYAAAAAALLSTAAPAWPWRELTQGIERLDALMYQQADARRRAAWDEDAQACDEALAVAMMVADVLAAQVARRTSDSGVSQRAARLVWFWRRLSGSGRSGMGRRQRAAAS